MKLSLDSVTELLNSKLTVFDFIKLSDLHGIWVRDFGAKNEFFIDNSFFHQLGFAVDSISDEIDWRDLVFQPSKESFFKFLNCSESEIKKIKDFTFGFNNKNGTVQWFFFNTIFIPADEQVFQVFLIKDITEIYSQKLISDNNKTRFIKLNQLLSRPSDIILIINHNYTFIDFLVGDETYLFKNPAEFIGKKIDEIDLPKHVENLMHHALNSAMKTGENQLIKYSLLINNRIEYFTLEVSKHSLSSFNKAEFLCLIKNISQEINSELDNKKQGEKLHALFSVMDDLKFIFDRNGTYKEVIATKDALLVETSENLIGKNLSDFFEPHITSEFLRFFELSFTSKKPQTLTYSIDFGDKKHSFEARIFPLEANNEILALVRDITEESKVQEKIKQDHELLHKLSEHLPGCFFVFERKNDGNYIYNYLSDGFLKIIPDILINEVINDFSLLLPYFHKEDLNPFIQAVELSAEQLSPFQFDFRIHVPPNSNKQKWIKAKSMPERKSDGSVVWHGYMEDVTKEKLQEQKVLENENRYRSLFSYSPQPMWIFDMDSLKFLEVNDTAVSFYGFSRDEFLSMTILDIRPEDEITKTISIIKSSVTEIQTFKYLKHRKKNGQLIYVSLTYHTLVYNNKNARHVVITDLTDIVEKENQIQAISQEFERVFNGTQESLQLIEYFPDREFRYVRTNFHHQEVTGLSLESLRGKTPYELFEKDQAEAKVTKFKHALGLGKPIEFLEFVNLQDGEHIWKTTLSPYITKSAGVYIVSSSIDITQQVKAEEKLAENIKKLEFTIDAGKFGAWEWNVETGNSTYSNNWATMIGYTLDEVGEHDSFYFDNLHPIDSSNVKELFSNVILEPEKDSFKVEYRMKTKDGNWKWIESHGKVIRRNKSGKAIYISGVNQDITERKQQELDLIRISTFLTQTSEVSQVGGWEYDLINNDYHLSEVVKNIYKISDEFINELNHKNNTAKLLDFYKEGESQEKITFHLSNLVKHQIPFDDEFEFISANGVEKWIRVIGKPVISDGKVAKIYGSMSDITEQKNNFLQINKLLELTHFQNQKLKEYTYLTSHNLRLPIVNLISLCSLMKDDDEKEKYIDMIDRSAHKLNDTMKIMHDILVIEQGKEADVKESVNIELAVLRNYELIAHLFRSEIDFTTEIDSSLFVSVIPAYFDSILNNMITNALKYKKTNSKAVIKITAEIENDFALIKISDQGLGLDMKIIKNKLFKLNNRFHKHIEGKGIGLFYSKSQIDAMGGKVEVESEVGVGSTFSIWLPLSEQEN